MQANDSIETSEQSLPGWLTRLRDCIANKGITQDQLTSVLGVETRGAVGHYLNDRRQMTITQFSNLCRVVGVHPNAILGFDDDGLDDEQSEQLGTQMMAYRPSVADRLKRSYRDKIQACDEQLMQLRADNRYFTRQGDSGLEGRQQTLNTIRVLAAQRQCYLQAEADISAIEDELGIG